MNFIKKLDELSLKDGALFGGKNASLGQLITLTKSHNIKVPSGFAIGTWAYQLFLEHNYLITPIKEIIKTIDINRLSTVQDVGKSLRSLILQGTIPLIIKEEIQQAYSALCKAYDRPDLDVAVRSSATAEDLPSASFAGQQESFLGICGIKSLLQAYQQCLASLFTDRAIIYRTLHRFDHMNVGISVGVQKMVRADRACSGVAFSLDPESGDRDLIVINAAWGLGELLVKGHVTPDEYRIFRPMLKDSLRPIIKKNKGEAHEKLIYSSESRSTDFRLSTSFLSDKEKTTFCLSDNEILALASITIEVEDSYSAEYGRLTPMDIEWAKDGMDGGLYLVQARLETVHGNEEEKRGAKTECLTRYFLVEHPSKTIVEGQSIGQKIATGPAKIIKNLSEASLFNSGDVLVAKMTDPDWLPLIKKASAVVTDLGGRTCHAAIVSRELGIPAIIGTSQATKKIKNEEIITVDCSQGERGFVYCGSIAYQKKTIDIDQALSFSTQLMLNIADPDQAFTLGQLPFIKGVGLARTEFIIANLIKIHPMACAHLERVKDKKIEEEIKQRTALYNTPQEFFVQTLAQGISTLVAAFYPRPVLIRFSDFKTNEYASLLGGSFFEQRENNPMLGLRGASRYYSQTYQDAFALECQAIKYVRNSMGLTNLICMIPFVRTVAEGKKVLKIMSDYGLQVGVNDLKIFMMVEIPSNIILLDQFAEIFDGFSIGSNDLTQFVLAVDRDSADLASLFDERDEAVKKMIFQAIKTAQAFKKPIGICGQAPSDYPEFAKALIEAGITSLSLNPDSLVSFLERSII